MHQGLIYYLSRVGKYYMMYTWLGTRYTVPIAAIAPTAK